MNPILFLKQGYRLRIQALSSLSFMVEWCPVERISELIRVRAYQLFEARGRRPGHELDDWLEAELELKRRFNLSD